MNEYIILHSRMFGFKTLITIVNAKDYADALLKFHELCPNDKITTIIKNEN